MNTKPLMVIKPAWSIKQTWLECVLPLEFIKKIAEEPFLNPKQNFCHFVSK